VVRLLRKVLKISAFDSPNVRRELARQRGEPESAWPPEIPGVLSWNELQKRLKTWDSVRVCVGIHAEFYEGAGALLYPCEWLNRAEQVADALRGKKRQVAAMGVDPAEGGDKSSWTGVDPYGLVFQLSLPTPDTTVVTARTRALMREYDVPPGRVVFDRGGGGKEHADRLRRDGFPVRTVAFGESLAPEPKRGKRSFGERLESHEERTAFRNRRAEMYWVVRQLLDPAVNDTGFGIPAEYAELRRQMAPIPLTYDDEGVFYVLPKRKKNPGDSRKTLTELIGCSPDELDSLALAVHGLLDVPQKMKAGAV